MTRQKKYFTEEERIEAYRKQQNNYSQKDWSCEDCDCIIRLGNKMRHRKSKKHVENEAKKLN